MSWSRGYHQTKFKHVAFEHNCLAGELGAPGLLVQRGIDCWLETRVSLKLTPPQKGTCVIIHIPLVAALQAPCILSNTCFDPGLA
eukprot:1158696-Pelagomonas_calceolata.AAC.8